MNADIRLLKSLPWFGTLRCRTSWATTYSRKRLGWSKRLWLNVRVPVVEQDAHFFRIAWI